jgi:4-amino-4-deoxy-L-arabinose transferase-like glycosyltransferase
VRLRVASWLGLGLVVLAAAAIRLRLLDIPLDRDEGEFAYFGQLLLDGVPPYASAYNLKMPGIYGAYALILGAFGQTAAGVHAGLILVTSTTTALTYLLARRLAGPAVGVMAAAILAAGTLNPKLLGTAAYSEHFVSLAAMAGFLALLRASRVRHRRLVLAAGLLFGLAFLMKQVGAAFIAGGAVFVLVADTTDGTPRWRERLSAVALLLVGALAPFALVCLALWRAGTFDTFWFWTIMYASEYSTSMFIGWANLVETLAYITPSLSVAAALAGVGLGAIVREPRPAERTLVLLLLAASALATAGSFRFRPQYFLLLLPAVAVIAGIGLSVLGRLVAGGRARTLRWAVPAALAGIAAGQPCYVSRDVLFDLAPVQVSRAVYGFNPFPESVEIARYIRERSVPGDLVAVIGSEPQIYFYAGRRSATGFIYTYALMERQPYASVMQRQMIDEIETANPRYLVVVHVAASWLMRPDSDPTIFDWIERYRRRFTPVGMVDIVSMQETVYRWGPDALGYAPRSDVWLQVLERGRQP